MRRKGTTSTSPFVLGLVEMGMFAVVQAMASQREETWAKIWSIVRDCWLWSLVMGEAGPSRSDGYGDRVCRAYKMDDS